MKEKSFKVQLKAHFDDLASNHRQIEQVKMKDKPENRIGDHPYIIDRVNKHLIGKPGLLSDAFSTFKRAPKVI